jgi:hypothetical protein
MASQAQQWRVLTATFRPYVSDEFWASLDEAPDTVRDEFNQWADEEEKK